MPLHHTENLNMAGNEFARIAVVCDSPGTDAYDRGLVMHKREMDKFLLHAENAGFDVNDFAFVTASPPLPDECGSSVRREDEFLVSYRDELQEALKSISNAEVVIVLGATAGAQVLPRFKIMQSRGQVKGTVDLGLGNVLPVFVMLKPSMILKRPESESLFETDFRQFGLLRQHGWSPASLADSMTQVRYEWVTDLTPLLQNPPKVIALDTETRGGLAWYQTARALCVQISWEEGRAWVIPVDRDYWPELTEAKRDLLLDQLQLLLSRKPRMGRKRRPAWDYDPKRIPAVVGHNLKFDLHILANEGISIANWHGDTMQLAFAVDENMQDKSLDECTRRWIPAMAGYADEFNKDPVHSGKEHMERVPHDQMLKYAGGDADAALRLAKVLNALVRKDTRNFNCYRRIQMPALRTFFRMERHGVQIDRDALRSFAELLRDKEAQLYDQLIAHVPAKVRRTHADAKNGLSFTRDNFVRDILFSEDGFRLKPRVFTPGTARLKNEAEKIPSVSIKQHLPYFLAFGVPWAAAKHLTDYIAEQNFLRAENEKAPLTDEECDRTEEKGFPFIPKLIEYRQVQKMRGTYVGVEEHEEEQAIKMVGKNRDQFPKKVRDALEAAGIAVDRAPKKAVTLPFGDKQFYWDKHGACFRIRHAATGYWKHMDANGRIHSSFMLHRAVTGRTSSERPNSQNFPKRSKLAKPYRRVFCPTEPGWLLAELDLSQIELRISASMARETNMIRIYAEGGDIHEATAAAVNGMTVEQLRALGESEHEMKRFQAKAVNFGFIYGMGWRKFMAYAKTDYGIEYSEMEAQEIREAFFARYPRLRRWHQDMRDFVNSHSYVRALHGALRRLPSVHSIEDGVQGEAMRQAVNSPVQRFASDLGLLGKLRFARDCDWRVMRPLMFVHDAVVIEAHPDYMEEGAAALKWYMENQPLREWFNLSLPVPLLSDAAIGPNLAQTSKRPDLVSTCPDWYRPERDAA